MTISPEPKIAKSASSRGQLVVLTMIAIAVIAATFAWWWNYNRGRQSLEFYGAEGATLIRTAATVELLRPAPEANLDISKAPGLINARASLLSDASYDWYSPDATQESPLFSVRFTNGNRTLTVTFDFENRTLKSSFSDRIIALRKKTTDGWQSYLSRQSKDVPRSPTTPPAPAHTAPSE